MDLPDTDLTNIELEKGSSQATDTGAASEEFRDSKQNRMACRDMRRPAGHRHETVTSAE